MQTNNTRSTPEENIMLRHYGFSNGHTVELQKSHDKVRFIWSLQKNEIAVCCSLGLAKGNLSKRKKEKEAWIKLEVR